MYVINNAFPGELLALHPRPGPALHHVHHGHPLDFPVFLTVTGVVLVPVLFLHPPGGEPALGVGVDT